MVFVKSKRWAGQKKTGALGTPVFVKKIQLIAANQTANR